MRSPKDMRIIQIDITNACVHQCSNCTRFCGHHRKPYFMDYDTFKRAVNSFEGFNGCVGVMGGEPTLHPEFARFTEYIKEHYPSSHNLECTRNPMLNFSEYIHDKNYILDETLNRRKGPGLWSSVCHSYYHNFELIQDVYSFQNINDHANDSLHQPMLASRKEMGIADDEWVNIRDNCIIQNQWSATITPKGAFFCEVAAALDTLFEGPGGWKIEPGWWMREPHEFGDQLKWCEICGGALFHSGRISNEEIDDVSPKLYEMLEKVGSPKLSRGKVIKMGYENDFSLKPMPDTINRYLPEHNDRVSKNNRLLNPDRLSIFHYSSSDFGPSIASEIYSKNNEWILIEKNGEIDNDWIIRLKEVVLNPGVIYLYRDLIIFNVRASALRSRFADISQMQTTEELKSLWNPSKVIAIKENFDSHKNPDIDLWYKYVREQGLEEDSFVIDCLNKIRNDYEKE
jgi:hypothetical protein